MVREFSKLFTDKGGIRGIIKKFVEPNFVEIDCCNSGMKKRTANINLVIEYSIIHGKKEIKDIKEYSEKRCRENEFKTK